MTSSNWLGSGRQALGIFLLAFLIPLQAQAALGDTEQGIEQERLHFGMHRAIERHALHKRHTLEDYNGSRVHQYVGAHGLVFAVTWQTPFKPDLSKLLGASHAGYAHAIQAATHKGGIQRQFVHQEGDTVVVSTAYLNKHAGYAYRRSLVPLDFDLSRLGRD